jgi:surface protein
VIEFNSIIIINWSLMKNFALILFILVGVKSAIAQSNCVTGIVTATTSAINVGYSTTISLSVPKGAINWEQSSDGINWVTVSGGSIVVNNTSSSVVSSNFSYTASVQTFTVPSGVTSINADGYAGAGGHGSSDYNGKGGLGGRLISSLSTTPGETLYIYVGGKGHNTSGKPGTQQQADNLWIASDAQGGFNGGGDATSNGGGGGGSTDIRQNGNSLSNRVFIVGAGGGGGNQRRISESGGNGGNGGGLIGSNGINGGGGASGGGGGSQSSGGSAGTTATTGAFGVGGAGATSSRNGGGGGGGFYGGGGGGWLSDKAGGGGGGGSSYTNGAITTNSQGNASATGDGSLYLSYSTPPSVSSTFTTPNLTSNIYYRAKVSDPSCNENYTQPILIKVINPFVTTWQTDAGTNVTIPLTGDSYDFDIDWGDGTIETKTGTPGNISHTYSTAGVKTVSIRPNITTGFPRIYVNQFTNKDLLLTVESWGSGTWGSSVNSSFFGASNLEVNATDTPDLSQTMDFSNMFRSCSALTGANGFSNWTLNTNATASIAFSELFSGCTAFNGDISTWNTSRVYLMNGMFRDAASFNQNIGNWNVSNVISMNGTFIGASIFNQSLNSWDVSRVSDMANMLRSTSYNQPLNWGAKTGNVTSMSGMFFGNTAFNQDVNGWDVSKVATMYQMFYGATAFNQNLNSWNVSKVINFVQMFAGATAFNGNISSWQFTTDVTKNIDMASMLRATTVFNQDISGWNVSRVTNMSNIFVSTRNFSQDLSSWDVSNVTNMRYMFHDCNFNAPLNWGAKTAKVTDMLGMFRGPSNFNQDISGWDVSSVTTMSEMFLNTSSFNQNLNTWDVSKVIDFGQMFYNASLFNGDISSWQFTTDVTKNISMASMFRDAPAFNQDLSNWNVSRVNQMQRMFQNSAFNQDMSAWDISNVSNLQLFLNGGQLSRANYNALLVGWSTLDSGETSIPSNLNADFGSSTYSNQPAVITARDTDLIASKNWTITDGGMFDSTVFTPTTITGTTTICAGDSTTLTASGGTTNANTVDVWYEGACGGEAYHEGWDTVPPTGLGNTTVNSVSNGILNVTSYSGDPMIEMYSIGSFNPSIYKYINIRYRVVSGTAGVTQIFFTNNTYTTANSVAYLNRSLVSDGNWHTQSIDMSTHADWATGGNITGWRYDFATVSGVTMELDFIELSTQPILGTGSSITVSPTANTSYYVNRKGPETNTSCISQLVTVNQIPTISNFNNYSKTYFDGSFTIANPTSTSAGSFTYSSDNTGVATISGNTVTITGIGPANITATQAANGSFCSNSASVLLTVNSFALTDKYGKMSTTNANYINSNGAIGTDVGVNKYGAVLKVKSPFSGGTFAGFTYNLVTSATGKVWLDRNLGATQVATSSTDAASFGDLYQWGRGTDGHEKRTSTNINTVSTTDTPGHGFFINANSFNWQSPVNTGLWQGVDGKNNPCPNGFRLPIIEELEAEVVLWSSQNAAGALASSLKLPIAGRRHTDGIIYSVGSNGMYRTNSTLILNITSTLAARAGDERIDGFCVRCIKD